MRRIGAAKTSKFEPLAVPPQTDTDYLSLVGAYALRFVKPGMTIGLGTGRAASAFIHALAKSGMRVRGVPTSKACEALARELGIEVVGLGDVPRLDVTLDGADEVDPRLNLIKGYGGALVREKVVAVASRRQVILVGEEKLVKRLGERGSLPVEVIPFAAPLCMRRIAALGLKPRIRAREDGSRYITDNGNLVFDCGVKAIANPARLDCDLLSIPGVLGTGIFAGIAAVAVVGSPNGSVRVMRRPT